MELKDVTKEILKNSITDPTKFEYIELYYTDYRTSSQGLRSKYAGVALISNNEFLYAFYSNLEFSNHERFIREENLREAKLYARGYAHARKTGPSLFLGVDVTLHNLGKAEIKSEGAYNVNQAIKLLIMKTSEAVQ